MAPVAADPDGAVVLIGQGGEQDAQPPLADVAQHAGDDVAFDASVGRHLHAQQAHAIRHEGGEDDPSGLLRQGEAALVHPVGLDRQGTSGRGLARGRVAGVGRAARGGSGLALRAGRRQVAHHRHHQPALIGRPGQTGREDALDRSGPAVTIGQPERVVLAVPRQQSAVGAPCGVPLPRAGRHGPHGGAAAVGGNQRDMGHLQARLHRQGEPARIRRPGRRPGLVEGEQLAGRQNLDVGAARRIEHAEGRAIRQIGDVAPVGGVNGIQGVARRRRQGPLRHARRLGEAVLVRVLQRGFEQAPVPVPLEGAIQICPAQRNAIRVPSGDRAASPSQRASRFSVEAGSGDPRDRRPGPSPRLSGRGSRTAAEDGQSRSSWGAHHGRDRSMQRVIADRAR